MIEFILGFCFAIAIVAILSRQQAIKDIQKVTTDEEHYKYETLKLMRERNATEKTISEYLGVITEKYVDGRVKK